MATNICLIIAGAGRSSRFRGGVGKIYVKIGDKPVFLWALDRFSDFSEITQKLLVVRPEELERVSKQWGAELKKRNVDLIGGGERRFDSVKAALAAGFNVITEVGKKKPGEKPAVSLLHKEISQDLECGATKVIVEARAAGRGVGIFDGGMYGALSLMGVGGPEGVAYLLCFRFWDAAVAVLGLVISVRAGVTFFRSGKRDGDEEAAALKTIES